jgi:hypothetical protein
MHNISSPDDIEVTADDREYLSYFNVSRVCGHENKSDVTSSWMEWIEPLTVHARHPFSLFSCGKNDVWGLRDTASEPSTGAVHIENIDYILLKITSTFR